MDHQIKFKINPKFVDETTTTLYPKENKRVVPKKWDEEGTPIATVHKLEPKKEKQCILDNQLTNVQHLSKDERKNFEQKASEESDQRLLSDLFAVDASQSQQPTIDHIQTTLSDQDWNLFTEQTINKLNSKDSKNMLKFMSNIIKLATQKMLPEQITQLQTQINLILIDKQKTQTNKKKSQSTRAQLNIKDNFMDNYDFI